MLWRCPPAAVWQLSGSVSLAGAYNVSQTAPRSGKTDYRGLSRLRPELGLDLDLELPRSWQSFIGLRAFYDLAYAINGRNIYTAAVRDDLEHEIELGEAFVQGPLSANLDLKAGRQIVVWGKSDNIRVVDVLNPLDNRVPGLVDIEEQRLPLTMTKLDYYVGPWNLSAIGVHEIRFGKTPVFGSDFYPLDAPRPPGENPAPGFDQIEAGLALKGIFSGWDLSLYGAWFFDDLAHLERIGSTGPPKLRPVHSRLGMLATAVNLARGNWLFKSELALFDGLEFFNTPGKSYTRADVLLGLEYSGISETTISLEAVNRHLFDFDTGLENDPDNAEPDDFQSALRIARDFRNDTLSLTLLALVFGLAGENGALERISLDYDLTDHWALSGGLVFYQSGDKTFFRHIGANDRCFLEAKFSF